MWCAYMQCIIAQHTVRTTQHVYGCVWGGGGGIAALSPLKHLSVIMWSDFWMLLMSFDAIFSKK